jgi:hypothetical protein
MCSDGSNRKQYSHHGKNRADAIAVDKLLKSAFKDYVPYFALADQRVCCCCDLSAILSYTLFLYSLRVSFRLPLHALGGWLTPPHRSIPQQKAGTAMLVHKSCKPLNVAYSLEPGAKFEPEGRVILAEVALCTETGVGRGCMFPHTLARY